MGPANKNIPRLQFEHLPDSDYNSSLSNSVELDFGLEVADMSQSVRFSMSEQILTMRLLAPLQH